MSEWKEFTGSEDQIHEMIAADEWIVKYIHSTAPECTKISEINIGVPFYHEMEGYSVKEYLICNPHPLADMICQQARTGQEVWVLEPIVGTEDHPLWPRLLAEGMYRENVGTAIMENGLFCQYSTRTPYWHIPDAQYSFTRNGGYRANK